MSALLNRRRTSLGHGVHSAAAFALLTTVLDMRGAAYYPEHPQRTLEERLRLHLLCQCALHEEVVSPRADTRYRSALIRWQTDAPVPEHLWDCGNILWHQGRTMPPAFAKAETGIVIDYRGGQLLVANSRIAGQKYRTIIRHS